MSSSISESGQGRSFLIVEDQFLIALDLKATLRELGCAPVELAQNLEGALSAARSSAIHAALLDINLSGTRSFEVASVLKNRAIPFAFLTGCDQAEVPREFAETPILTKPFSRSDVERLLARLS